MLSKFEAIYFDGTQAFGYPGVAVTYYTFINDELDPRLKFTYWGTTEDGEHSVTVDLKISLVNAIKSVKLGKADPILLGDPQTIQVPILADPSDIAEDGDLGEMSVNGLHRRDWNKLNALFNITYTSMGNSVPCVAVEPVKGAALKAGSYTFTLRFADYKDAKGNQKPVKLTVKVVNKPFALKLSATKGTLNRNLPFDSFAVTPMIDGKSAFKFSGIQLVGADTSFEGDRSVSIAMTAGRFQIGLKHDENYNVTTAKGKHVVTLTFNGANINTAKGKNVLKLTVDVVDSPITLTAKVKQNKVNLLDAFRPKSQPIAYNYVSPITIGLSGKAGTNLKTLLDDPGEGLETMYKFSINYFNTDGKEISASDFYSASMPVETKALKVTLTASIGVPGQDLNGTRILDPVIASFTSKEIVLQRVKTAPKITAEPITFSRSAPYERQEVKLDIPFGMFERMELAPAKNAQYKLCKSTDIYTRTVTYYLAYADPANATTAPKSATVKLNVHLKNADKPVTVSVKVENLPTR